MFNTWEGKIRLGTENCKAALLGQLDARFRLLVEEEGQVVHRANNETNLDAPEEAEKESHGVREQVQLCEQM